MSDGLRHNTGCPVDSACASSALCFFLFFPEAGKATAAAARRQKDNSFRFIHLPHYTHVRTSSKNSLQAECQNAPESSFNIQPTAECTLSGQASLAVSIRFRVTNVNL